MVQGDRPRRRVGQGLVGHDGRRHRVPRLLGRDRRHVHRALPPARRGRHPRAGRPLHPRPGERATATTCSSRSRPGSPSWRPAPSTRSSTPTRGAEITEAAVKLAKQVTKRPNVIVFSGSFHGRTHLAMAMTTSKTSYRSGHQPLPAGVFVAPFPDPLGVGPGGRDRPVPGRRAAPPQGPDRARRDRGHDPRAGAGRGRLRALRRRGSCRGSSSCAGSTASCSSPTRSRRASAAPAGCSRSSTTASSPTSSAWPRASRPASPSPHSARRPS